MRGVESWQTLDEHGTRFVGGFHDACRVCQHLQPSWLAEGEKWRQCHLRPVERIGHLGRHKVNGRDMRDLVTDGPVVTLGTEVVVPAVQDINERPQLEPGCLRSAEERCYLGIQRVTPAT
jgi:hypothetical protein